MTRINNFTINSDFPSLHNNGEALLTFKIPAGQPWQPFGLTTRSMTAKLGAKDSSIRALWNIGGRWYCGTAVTANVPATVDGMDYDDILFAWIERVDNNTISINASLENGQAATEYNKSEITLIARVSTFATPL